MARPNRLKQIEQEYNEPLEPLILRLLNELGSIPAVAQCLGTTMQTIFYFCQRHNIQKQISWVKKDTETLGYEESIHG